MPSNRRIRSSKLAAAGPYASPSLRIPDSDDSDDTWSNGDDDVQSFIGSSSRSWQDLDFSELDQAVDQPFKSGDIVWVRTREHNWRLGKVVKNQARTRPLARNRKVTAHYYQVQFGTNGRLRKYFAPLNGEMKPDTPETRELLLAGGWISNPSIISD